MPPVLEVRDCEVAAVFLVMIPGAAPPEINAPVSFPLWREPENPTSPKSLAAAVAEAATKHIETRMIELQLRMWSISS